MKKKTTRATNRTTPLKTGDEKLPFLEHFYELKRRLTYIAISVVGFGAVAYGVQQHIVSFLLRPAHGQNLIYTSVGGGLDFLFRICIYTGIVCSLPIIIYQFLKYLEPVLGSNSMKYALGGSFISAILALSGMAFGYYAGMPTTLHFLFHQFTTTQIHPLIAVQSYMSFVTMYMFGAALLFQLPLIIIFINRIKPLKPRSLLKYERWMILVAFILAVIMNPTPNPIDQLMLAGPMILTYQIGIVLVAIINRPRRSPKVNSLLVRDAEIQAERLSRFADAQKVWLQAEAIADNPVTALPALQSSTTQTATILSVPSTPSAVPVRHARPPVSVADHVTPASIRPHKYVDSFNSSRRIIRTI
jgi:sec-independent protein translocase protein TatC